MREEAFAKTMRHPLESKFVHEGRQPRLSFQMARTLLALGAAKGLPIVITMRTAAGPDFSQDDLTLVAL